MAEPTGTARQEAERLVATVLAMASQAGLGGPPKDRDPAGPAGLTDMISGLVGQFTGGTPESPPRATEREAPEPGADSRPPAGPQGDGAEPEWDWREAYQHTLDSLGAAARSRARQAAGRQLWEGVTRFGGWSTGSAECCMCPICRAIAGVRNPSPEQAERLATGAGDLASGVAGVLRAFSTVTGTTGNPVRKPPARPTTTPDQAWSAATRRARPAESPAAAHEVREDDDPWTAATRASRAEPQAGKARAEQAATPSDVTGRAPESGDPWAAATASGPVAGGAGAWVVTAGGSVSQPAPAGGGASRDRHPEAPDGDARAAEQAGVQTDAVGPVGAAPRGPVQGDPWAAATRAAERPASARGAGAAVSEAGGAGATGHTATTPGVGGADVAARGAGAAAPKAGGSDAAGLDAGGAGGAAVGPGSAQAAPTAAAPPTADLAPDAHRAPTGEPAAAVGEARARTGELPGQAETGSRPAPDTERTPTAPSSLRGRLADNGPGASRRVTGATDVWAAVTAANGDTAGDTGVAHTPSVDHDVPGTAPAAEAAEGRGAGPGDDARSGDAV